MPFGSCSRWEGEKNTSDLQVHSSWARFSTTAVINTKRKEFKDTTKTLRENTYVDNIMKTGHESEELNQFKNEATEILENARFPVHKWESNLPELESDDMANPGKILGRNWDKRKDTLDLPVQQLSDEQPVTKRATLSHLGSMTLSGKFRLPREKENEYTEKYVMKKRMEQYRRC